MAPRREESNSPLAVSEERAFCTYSPFSGDRVGTKSISLLSMDECSTPVEAVGVTTPNLKSSLESISSRGDQLLSQVCDTLKTSDSLIVNTCHSSLQSEFSSMLDEARLLLNHLGTGSGDSPLTMVTSWRVSLAQIRVDAYLEAIATAMKCTELDASLAPIVDALSSQLNSQVSARISPWNTSSLTFDVTAGHPVQCKQKHELPLQLQVQPIVAIHAKDLYNERPLVYQACKVTVERCVHVAGTYRAGAVGDALLQLKVSPVDDGNTEKSAPWRQNKQDVGKLHVKEARTVQTNAFPPCPKASVDLYVSTNHGERDTTITLRFPTYKTLKDVTPDIFIELVVG